MLRSHRWTLAVTVFAIALLPAPARRQDDWVHFGMRQVDFRVDHDVIRAAAQGRFRRVRLVVEGGDLELFTSESRLGTAPRFRPPRGCTSKRIHAPA